MHAQKLTNLLDEIPEGSGAVEPVLCRTSVRPLKPLYELSESLGGGWGEGGGNE